MDARQAESAARPPKFLNLLQIRQPVNAVLSIAHRASGLLLFLAIPGLLWALGRALESPAAYAALGAALDGPLARAGLLVLAWALVHHTLAGARFLVMDLGYGESLRGGRRGAWAVFAVEAVVMLAVLGLLL